MSALLELRLIHGSRCRQVFPRYPQLGREARVQAHERLAQPPLQEDVAVVRVTALRGDVRAVHHPKAEVPQAMPGQHLQLPIQQSEPVDIIISMDMS